MQQLGPHQQVALATHKSMQRLANSHILTARQRRRRSCQRRRQQDADAATVVVVGAYVAAAAVGAASATSRHFRRFSTNTLPRCEHTLTHTASMLHPVPPQQQQLSTVGNLLLPVVAKDICSSVRVCSTKKSTWLASTIMSAQLAATPLPHEVFLSICQKRKKPRQVI